VGVDVTTSDADGLVLCVAGGDELGAVDDAAPTGLAGGVVGVSVALCGAAVPRPLGVLETDAGAAVHAAADSTAAITTMRPVSTPALGPWVERISDIVSYRR
jgi:hypothetical protein